MTRPPASVPFARVTAPSERRIKLTLHYDGSGFHGWQMQPGRRTVQSEVQTALSRLAGRPTSLVAAGRTDRGVHATGQVASAVLPEPWTAATLRRALNAVLPADVWVASAEQVSSGFHARYDAVARSYVYHVGTAEAARSPFLRRWCWPLGRELDDAALEQAAAKLTGEHSFRAFARAGQEQRGDRCTVYRARWTPWAQAGTAFHVTANRFLHRMVRYLVGTMVDVAQGRRPAADIDGLLAGEAGLETSPPAPPEGLFLRRVVYTLEELQPEEPTDEDIP